ncbi:uncharacterized protein L969DRAFT_97069 [Mixia osmundae IAM 14324]|uniref:Nicotinamide-nucleotide adenylyltransferase n=1 Tax=Mixia osmundae (strain CBS 9802 / IAM 14324 / JCM 22182 / KY 12970) TaxID=764103 RepID=G7E1K7_MIXOS|nr:uncharacterized protein L969DRAFT_97069 [Mixia osmundae IAM 14324]KEI36669.1 hypothetical protein L969DRAFT_97069 [Mixia osmundae IAM 14324]GAA96717.1 hypothetical protein E5Q_03388 [Mixia osmundae IAM 14324]
MQDDYVFPTERLVVPRLEPGKQPLVLVGCGSFSPITFLHLRMFEMARDHARLHSCYEVVGGYLSPVNDAYKKPGLVSAVHRVSMCELACQSMSDWIMVDPFEARHDTYLPTARVLDHFEHEINTVKGGVEIEVLDPETGETSVERRKARIMLLAGSDLIQTMSEPGVWAQQDLHHILGLYGCFIVERADSEIDQALFKDSSVHSRNALALYRRNIFMVQQLVRNDVSSTKVRLFIKRGMSVRYLLPNTVIDYIRQNGLYSSDRAPSSEPASRPTTSSSTPDSLQKARR